MFLKRFTLSLQRWDFECTFGQRTGVGVVLGRVYWIALQFDLMEVPSVGND
jgi:hypothetical protein